jgi:hypothetical protein
MVTYPNRFFYGFSVNDGNHNSHFIHYIIETVHDISDYNGDTIIERVSRMEDYYLNTDRIDEPYYIVYGSLKPEFNESSKFIASFENLSQAICLVEHLTGNKIVESDLPIYRQKHEN